MEVQLIEISKINQHEAIDQENLMKVRTSIVISGIFKEPIIVDKHSLVVLDGHHRLNSCQQLGLTHIPCLLVDYLNDKKIKVVSRRKEIPINKNIVINKGLSGQVFPKKTTKHYIPHRVKNLHLPIDKLKN